MATALTLDQYHLRRRALQRRMWSTSGQWIGGADAEAAQVELRALDADWMYGPEAQQKTEEAEAEYQQQWGRGPTWGT